LNAHYKDTGNKEETIHFTFGEGLSIAPSKTKKQSENIFNQSAENIEITVENYERKVEFKQSNKSKDFVNAGIEEDEETLKKKSYIQLGSIMHAIFSTIKTKKDIGTALRNLEEEGILYNKVITQDKLRKTITERLNDPRVSSWFSERWSLFNECSILKVNPLTDKVEERRPDRVMTDGKEMIVVDYKFGSPKEEHKAQVKEYMDLLHEMGHHNITGYLWYLFSNKIIKL